MWILGLKGLKQNVEDTEQSLPFVSIFALNNKKRFLYNVPENLKN